jgi:hypothetical protein
MFMVID